MSSERADFSSSSRYPCLNSNHDVVAELELKGVDIFMPTSDDSSLADDFEEFASFVLHVRNKECRSIILDDENDSVGQLQGGTEKCCIFRVSFPEDTPTSAASLLLDYFNSATRRTCSRSALTTAKIRQYMLNMCNRRCRQRNLDIEYNCLGNCMFIIQFGGPTNGQVRHIDNMIPNLQVCLYMSTNCPSTIVYAMDDQEGPSVTDGRTLIDFWHRQRRETPNLVEKILLDWGSRNLRSKWYTRYFSRWISINKQLQCFGRLYQNVEYQLGLADAAPGTTLIAGGNEIHAGPPTSEARMFAFSVAMPSDSGGHQEINHNDGKGGQIDTETNDGETQYNPLLLHLDFCCIAYSILDYELASPSNGQEIRESKIFLINLLVEVIRDYPMQEYLLQICPSRVGVLAWLTKTLSNIEHGNSLEELVEDAVSSKDIFYSPDVVKRNGKKRGRRKAKRP
mmetsp:Transcript_30673/g.69298  ORF Transcript_30673/g.69298 Transcript_30673/m.69298 type:complete len:453 (+) Transcript_30673:100-1458(+)